jgi:hypothetical protein
VPDTLARRIGSLIRGADLAAISSAPDAAGVLADASARSRQRSVPALRRNAQPLGAATKTSARPRAAGHAHACRSPRCPGIGLPKASFGPQHAPGTALIAAVHQRIAGPAPWCHSKTTVHRPFWLPDGVEKFTQRRSNGGHNWRVPVNEDLFVKRVPQVIKELVAREAARNHRSTNQEAIALLEEALLHRVEAHPARRSALAMLESYAAGAGSAELARAPGTAPASPAAERGPT